MKLAFTILRALGSRALLAPFLGISLVLVAVGASIDPAPAFAAEVDDEAAFVARINNLRSNQGLPPLAVDTELVIASRAWAVQLSEAGVLSHAPDLSVGVTSHWAKLGENVGVADVDQFDQLFNAFVNSPGHYANLVDPAFTHIGTGVVYDADGRMWTTHRFMAKIETTTTTVSTTEPPTSSTTSSTVATSTTTTDGSTSSTGLTTTTGSTTSTTTETTVTSELTTTTVPETSDGRPRLQAIPAQPFDREILTKLFADLAT